MREQVNEMYNIARNLEKKVADYVKSKGGLVDCQPCLGGDCIYGYSIYGGDFHDEVVEMAIYAIRCDENGGLSFLMEPITRSYVLFYTAKDYFKEDAEWYDLDDTLSLNTIASIAENIEEYDAPNDEEINERVKELCRAKQK